MCFQRAFPSSFRRGAAIRRLSGSGSRGGTWGGIGSVYHSGR